MVTIAEECIHRWGYRLAKSPDNATIVAAAVVALCDEPILTQIRRLAEVNQDRERSALWVNKRSRDLALAYVVQARAGNCPVPK